MRRERARAFTIVESVISTVIVGMMLVAALNTVGVSRLTQHRVALTDRGRLLAEQLLSEILEQNYEDTGNDPLFGGESGESTTTRADFDDVDDYNGWAASPPTAKDGAVLANSAGWKQTVTVEWIDRLDPTLVQAVETGAKRITVTISCSNVPQATLAAIKTAAQ